MRLVVLALVLTLVSAAPAAAAPSPVDDRTAALLADLDRCAPRVNEPRPPLPFGTLLALADGRSAREFADLVTKHGCVSYAQAYGEGDDEIALVGTNSAPTWPNGAILWVDRGWWRIARAPTGYSTTLVGVHRVGDSREIFFGLGSGGSAGDTGVAGIRLTGATASIVLDTSAFLSDHVGAILIDQDHVVVSGRKLPNRPYAWPANCCLPGGHEWLFTRAGTSFILAAERQAIDPYFALSAFIGGASVHDASFMRDVGTDRSIREALDGAPMDIQHVGSPTNLYALTRTELLSWDAIPAASRGERSSGPVYASSYILNARYQLETNVVFELDPDAGGWRVTAVFFEDRLVRRPHGPS